MPSSATWRALNASRGFLDLITKTSCQDVELTQADYVQILSFTFQGRALFGSLGCSFLGLKQREEQLFCATAGLCLCLIDTFNLAQKLYVIAWSVCIGLLIYMEARRFTFQQSGEIRVYILQFVIKDNDPLNWLSTDFVPSSLQNLQRASRVMKSPGLLVLTFLTCHHPIRRESAMALDHRQRLEVRLKYKNASFA